MLEKAKKKVIEFKEKHEEDLGTATMYVVVTCSLALVYYAGIKISEFDTEARIQENFDNLRAMGILKLVNPVTGDAVYTVEQLSKAVEDVLHK